MLSYHDEDHFSISFFPQTPLPYPIHTEAKKSNQKTFTHEDVYLTFTTLSSSSPWEHIYLFSLCWSLRWEHQLLPTQHFQNWTYIYKYIFPQREFSPKGFHLEIQCQVVDIVWAFRPYVLISFLECVQFEPRRLISCNNHRTHSPDIKSEKRTFTTILKVFEKIVNFFEEFASCHKKHKT